MNHYPIVISWLGAVYSGTSADEFRQSLLSIKNQDSLVKSEVILVEDGPISSSLKQEIIRLSKNFAIENVVSDINLGLGPALALGLKHCRGKYIARFDTDDINSPDRITRQLEVIERDDSIDLVCSSVYEFQDTDLPTIRVALRSSKPSYKIQKLLCFYNPIYHPTVLLRASTLDRLSLSYEECPLFEDYLLWLMLLNRGGSFVSTDQPLVYMRVKPAFANRHGFLYALREFSFYRTCFSRGLLPKVLLVLYFFRIVSRLIPSSFIQRLLRRAGRSHLFVSNPLLARSLLDEIC